MRRLCVTLILSAILPLIAPAHADAFWRWLDELSGPGKFHGADFDIRIVCSTTKASDKEYESELMDGRITEQDTKQVYRTFAGVATPCIFQNQGFNKRRTGSFNVALGYQLAQRTNLVFEDMPEQERSVFLFSVRPMGWWRPKRWLEIGGGSGIYAFKTTGEDAFPKITLEGHVDVKPFALIRDTCKKPLQGIPDSQYDQLLSVRVGLMTFLGGFDASDFGATSFKGGATTVDAEKIWSLSIILDLEPAFRRKKAERELGKRLAMAREKQTELEKKLKNRPVK